MLRMLFGRKFNFFDIFVMGFAVGADDLAIGLLVIFAGAAASAAGEHALDRRAITPS